MLPTKPAKLEDREGHSCTELPLVQKELAGHGRHEEDILVAFKVGRSTVLVLSVTIVRASIRPFSVDPAAIVAEIPAIIVP